MNLVVIPLKDIILDPKRDIDLSSLPEEEAIALIKESYGFLSSSIEVTIKEGVAIIRLIEVRARRVDDVLALYDQAVKQAQKGKYRRAIQLFTKVISELPDHTDARRDLAMAYFESGNMEEARNHLIEVLPLNPRDSWGYLLLGNIYFKHERDLNAFVFLPQVPYIHCENPHGERRTNLLHPCA